MTEPRCQHFPLCCIFVWFCVDLGIDVPDFLDLSRLRATGLQAGEEELPDLMPPIVLPEDTRGMDTTFYSQVVQMMFVCVCVLLSVG